MTRRKHGDSKVDALKRFGCLHSSPETIKDELFETSDFFDPRDQVQIKYEMLRRVKSDKQPVSYVAANFGFSRPAFYQILEAFEKEGLQGLIPKKPGPRSAHKLSDEVMEFVAFILSENQKITSIRLTELIKERFGISVHPRSVERALLRRKKKPSHSD